MNLNALRLFSQVAHRGSFSRAAVAASISQPAVSRAVAELEEALGLQLFDRTRRPLNLTLAGHRLFAHAEAIFATERQAHLDLQAIRDVPRPVLQVASSAVLAEISLARPIAQFMQEYPDTDVRIIVGNLHTSGSALGNGHADIAIVEGILSGFEHLATTPWRDQELALFVPHDHEFARREAIDLVELASYPFIHRESGSATGGFVAAILKAGDVEPVRFIEAPDTRTMLAMVAAGIGTAIAPVEAAIASHAAPGMVRVMLNSGPIHRTNFIARIESGAQKAGAARFHELMMASV